MSTLRRVAASLMMLILLSSIGFADVVTDYDHHAVFERYHTYSWAKVQTDDPLWQQRIMDAVDRALQAKGWQRVDSGGDVAIAAVGAVHTQKEYQTYYDGMGGFGWGWGTWGPTIATTTVQNTPVRTLIVDMFDARTKQLIWRGRATDTLSNNPNKNENKLQKAVDKMFEHFPPKS